MSTKCMGMYVIMLPIWTIFNTDVKQYKLIQQMKSSDKGRVLETEVSGDRN